MFRLRVPCGPVGIAVIRRAGAPSGLQPRFEVSRGSAGALSYLLVLDESALALPALPSLECSAVIAEMQEIDHSDRHERRRERGQVGKGVHGKGRRRDIHGTF